MAKLDIKTNLLDHSEAKVKLLGEYIKRYLNIISNDGYTERISIHDLFCGPGIYDNGGHGSPIVTLKHVKETYYTIVDKKVNKLPKIDCYFNDIDQTKIDALRASISNNSYHYPTIGQLNFTAIDYKQKVIALKEKFQKLGNEKAFVFIDPYGYKDLAANDIKDLLGTHKKSEVLIWLPIQFMYRFASGATPDVLKNLISDLGITEAVSKAQNVWDFISCLKNGFQDYLGDHFFVDNFSLKKEENTVFCLFFFTSHIKGFEKMLESKWQIDTEQGRGWEYRGNIPTLFYDQKTNRLEELLRSYFSSGKRSNSDTYKYVLREGYLTKHATEVLANLQKNNLVDVYLNNGEKARKNAFYIKYFRSTDVINNKKVYFVLK